MFTSNLQKISRGWYKSKKKESALQNIKLLYEKAIHGIERSSELLSHLKISTPKQMLQRLPIALAQVKAGNTSGNLIYANCQITYSLYCGKTITKKVY